MRLRRGHRLLWVAIHCACALAASGQSPLHQWRFAEPDGEPGVIRDLVGGKHATIVGEVEFEESPASLRLNGRANHLGISDKGTAITLPTKAIALEAWVALEKASKYNNIIGFIQDNGSFEKGWLLGGHDTRFQFAIGTDRLTYLRSKTEFEPGRWHHLVGTYDGENMRLYVDGRLDASATQRMGPIQYADSWWRIAGYKDDNEVYPFHGRLHEIAVYDQALKAEQIRARYLARKSVFPPPPLKPEDFLALGPYLQFETPTTAAVRWRTREPQSSRLQFRMADGAWRDAGAKGARTNHIIRLNDLPHRSKFQYRILGSSGSREGKTDNIPIDTTFNFTTPSLPAKAGPFPDDELTGVYAAAAERILARSGITDGYCLDFGCGEGRLALELARRSRLMVVGVNEDPESVQRIRRNLTAAGLYGQRVTVHHAPDGKLPFPDYCFNLVVSDHSVRTGELPNHASEMRRHLRPSGGVLIAGGERTIRPPLAGGGSWTHMYGDAGQTSNSHDELLSGRTGDTIEVQWFGLPGPDAMIDRLGRNQGPLSYRGRLFTQGNNRLIVQDSYNGRILWSLEIPDLRRTNVKVDTSNSCLDETACYLAIRDRCWKVDAATGKLLEAYAITETGPDERPLNWGYVASEGNLLFGSAVRRGASFSDFHGADKWYDKPTGVGAEKICSDTLFAIDKNTGDRVWTYGGGAILNPTVSLGDGRVYLLESRHPKILETDRGRVGMPELYEELHLVALDQHTGSVVWEKPVDYGKRPTVLYLCHSDRTLVVQSSLPDDKTYNLFVYESKDGTDLWKNKYPWRRSDHGHHVQHPVIAGNRLIAQPEFFELRTGKKLGDTPERTKCSTMTGAANLLHYRDFYDEVWDLTTGETTEWKGLRSGCWLGIVSADGMILSSESGGGCSCNFPIQLSIGYRTKNDY